MKRPVLFWSKAEGSIFTARTCAVMLVRVLVGVLVCAPSSVCAVPMDRSSKKPLTTPPAKAESSNDWRGKLIANRYQIGSQLGAGGFGIVYRAWDRRSRSAVAIKVLREEYGGRQSLRRRFAREAKALLTLSHPNVVAINDCGLAEGMPFFAMELLEGHSLERELKHRGPLPPQRCFVLIQQLLAGLTYVHEQGLVHRDLKPGNIFLQRRPDGEERVKLLDFGLAKFVDPSDLTEGQSLTNSGEVVGTPAYMPPEQLASQQGDNRSDVYSAAVVLFQMLSGRRPFEGEPYDVLRMVLVNPAPSLSSACDGWLVDSELDDVVARALCKDPDERFGSAEEFAQALKALPPPALWIARTEVDDGSDSDVLDPTADEPVALARIGPDQDGQGSQDSQDGQEGTSLQPVDVGGAEEDDESLDEEPSRRRRGFPAGRLALASVVGAVAAVYVFVPGVAEQMDPFLGERWSGDALDSLWERYPVGTELEFPDLKAQRDRLRDLGLAWGADEQDEPVGTTRGAVSGKAVGALGSPSEDVVDNGVLRQGAGGDAFASAADRAHGARLADRAHGARLAHEVEGLASGAAESKDGAGQVNEQAASQDESSSQEDGATESASHENGAIKDGGLSGADAAVAESSEGTGLEGADQVRLNGEGSQADIAVDPLAADGERGDEAGEGDVPVEVAAVSAGDGEAVWSGSGGDPASQDILTAEEPLGAPPKAAQPQASLAVRATGKSVAQQGVTADSTALASTAAGANVQAGSGLPAAEAAGSSVAAAEALSTAGPQSSADGADAGEGTAGIAADAEAPAPVGDGDEESGSPGVAPEEPEDALPSPASATKAAAEKSDESRDASAAEGVKEKTASADSDETATEEDKGGSGDAAEEKLELGEARDPWKQVDSRFLRNVRRRMIRGDHGDERTVVGLRRHNRSYPEDPRGHLLLAGLFMNRNWESDAVRQYEFAVLRDPTSRGDPRMLPDLLECAGHWRTAKSAGALVQKFFGKEAEPALKAAIARAKEDEVTLDYLTRLRDSLEQSE